MLTSFFFIFEGGLIFLSSGLCVCVCVCVYIYIYIYIYILLPPKAPFSTWPWEQTSSLLCELRGNFSLPFDLGHFEYYIARLIVCSSLSSLFHLVIWVETTTILVRWRWCLCQFVRMIPASEYDSAECFSWDKGT